MGKGNRPGSHAGSKELAKRIVRQTHVAHDVTHRDRVHWVVPWHGNYPRPVRHDDVFSLPGDPETVLLGDGSASLVEVNHVNALAVFIVASGPARIAVAVAGGLAGYIEVRHLDQVAVLVVVSDDPREPRAAVVAPVRFLHNAVAVVV